MSSISSDKGDLVVFDYAEVIDPHADLSEKLLAAFGRGSKGIAFIGNIPEYEHDRFRLLLLGEEIHRLPLQLVEKYTFPHTMYNVGMQNRRLREENSTSFAANPLTDKPNESVVQGEKHWNYPNCWISELPELEVLFKRLGRLMYHMGLCISKHVDGLLKRTIPTYTNSVVSDAVISSDAVNGRLIHYHGCASVDPEREKHWNHWHNDWTTYTVLCSPIYCDRTGNPLQLLDGSVGGLEIVNRNGRYESVAIPNECVGIQVGEATQILSGGTIVATPHRVVQRDRARKDGISRNQFIVFLTPRSDCVMSVPEGRTEDDVVNHPLANVSVIPPLRRRWRNGMSYKEFGLSNQSAYFGF